MLLFTAETPPITSPLISIVIQQEVVEPPPIEKVYTIEEKIKLNINNCDEQTQFIRADNAECLDKPVYKPTTARNPARGAVNASYGWFPYGQCTYWVSTQRSVGQWNNASDWLWQAKRDGWATGSTPVVGAIAWEYGHVAYVTAVNGDMVTVSEMNYVGWGVQSSRTVHSSTFQYIY